jgi:hypothetical protein
VLDAKRLLADCATSVQAVQRLSQGRTEQLNIGYVANVYHDLLPAKPGGHSANPVLGQRSICST